MSSISVFCFASDGNLIVRRNFTDAEVSAKTATFAIPNTAAGTNVEFYAVANTSIGNDITTKAALLALTETAAVNYNGTFAEVSTRAKRSGGFLMSGSATKTIAAVGSTTDVSIVLKRSVAKIAVQTALSSAFASKYSGKVRINSAQLSRAASRTPYFSGVPQTGTMTFTHTQSAGSSGEKYNNLFYAFENGNLAAGSRVLLTLEGTYDRDGDFSTTADQAPVSYRIELTGGGAGQLLRNGYYRVQVTLDGLTGSDATVRVSVAEWETPLTQTVSLGA